MDFDTKNYRNYKESNSLEAKSAIWKLPHTLWDTYSSFTNTYGGVILLGTEEQKDGSFVSSGLRDPDKLLKDFWNTINDSIRFRLIC